MSLCPAARLLLGLIISGAAAFAQNQPPVVSVTAPSAGTSVIGPAAIQLTATASSPDSTIASVAFYQGTTKLATETNSPYQYSWKNVPAGTYSITAVAKDHLGLSTTSSAVSITVTQDRPPVVTLIAPVGGATLIGPATIPLIATATSPDEGIVSVAFYNGTTKLATAKTTTPGTQNYQYSWKSVPAGTYTLTAVATDSLGVSTTSAPITITVNQDQPPVVSLTAPAGGFTTIGPATINLSATASSPDEIITSVAFYNGTTKIATGKATPYNFAWKNVAAGSYTLTAVATDALGVTTTSAPVSITVTQDQPPIVSITSPTNGASITGPATIVLTSSATSPDETIKSVTYYQGSTKLATETKAPYTYNWKNVEVGNYTLTAVAADALGVTTTSSAVAITVTADQPPSVSILTPASGATYVAPGSIELTASASSPDVTVASVAYYQGSTKLVTETKAPFAYNWKSVAAGSYTLTAVATDSVGGTTTSSPVTINVTSTTTSTVKITAPTSGKVLAAPASVTLTATASAPAGVASVSFYAGNTLLGTTGTSPYQYSWQNVPAGVYYLTAVETDTLGGTVTSSPVTFTSDAPPVVVLGTPASGSEFAAPATINLAATVTDAGKVTKVEFFQGSTLIGTSTVGPTYMYSWTSVPVGTYSVTAEAFDSLGITGSSPAASVQVINDVAPVITLLTPSNALSFSNVSPVSLSFSVTDSTSAVAKVEIYRAGVLVATLTSPTSGTTWTFTEQYSLPTGTYSYFARAYDATGTSTDTPLITVLVIPGLPYQTDFETFDGFTIGPLAGQVGWTVPQGSANVSSVAYSGSQSVQLASGSPVAIVQVPLAPSPGETIEFCDFYAEPVAEASIASSTIFTAEQAQFGFQQVNGAGVLYLYQGNGSGGGTWVPTTFTIALSSNNQAQTWVHLTARLDFTKKTWDIYANGNMIAYDIPFANSSSTYFSIFQVQGDANTDSFLDDMYIGPSNVLFSDSANDGINDVWKAQYGLPVASNDRYLNVSGDGIPSIQDFINGMSPLINTKVTPPPIQSGLVLDLRADAGVVADSNGDVSQWLDQSAQGNIAFQSNTPNEPQLAPGQVNGLPSLNFGGTDFLVLPYNMMQNAQAGEIIGVVKIDNDPTVSSNLWGFGTGYGTAYYGTQHFDDFGTSDTTAVQVETEAQISQYYIYDTSISSAGTSIYRYNGVPLWTRTGLPVGFQLYPGIGGSLMGNIAEVMVFNRVLTDAERFAIGQYLTGKYAFPSIVTPNAPTDLAAVAISSDTVDLSWTLQNPGSMHTVTTVERQSGSGAFAQVAQVNDAWGYTDTGLTAGTTYTYKITVQTYVGTSGLSNAASASTPSNIPDPPTQGLALWLRSTVGTGGSGTVSFWIDQSGLGNTATQNTPANQPQLVTSQANGLPVVRFNGSNDLNLPPLMLQNAQSGEIIALVKVGNNPGNSNTLWEFGNGYGTTYVDLLHYDDFGTTDTTGVTVETQAQISQYYVYDTAIDTSGNSTYRYDGTPLWARTGLPVSFGQYPGIGGYGGGSFVGDIAEIMVYSRVLSPQEQASVYANLAFKYSLPSIVANLASPVITSSANATGQVGQTLSYQITATGSPTSYAVSGLPSGLSFDAGAGSISGTPTATGTSTVTLTATNSSGTSPPFALTITVNPAAPVITSATSATGQVGQGFSYQIVAGGASSYSATGLPDGLSFDPVAGLISGTPTTAGTYSVALTGTNSGGSGTATLALTINPPAPALTSPTTGSGQVGQAFSYQVVASNGATGYSATGLPPGLSIDPVTGIISGTPTAAGTFTVILSLTNSYGTGTANLVLSIAPNFVVTNGMLLWLRADASVLTNGGGNVTLWTDQSGAGNNAYQSGGGNPPLLVSNQANGLPVVRFDGTDQLGLPYNMFQNAQSGEVIAVVKIGSDQNLNMLWNFGTYLGSSYVGGTGHLDDFGTNDTTTVQVETQAQLSQYYVYDTSISTNGTSTYRYDGTPLWTRTGLSVGFGLYPVIGGFGGNNFNGDIAEIFVFTRVLTAQEQSEVYGYLASRYGLSAITTNVGSPAITSGASATGQEGLSFSYQISASNGPTSYGAPNLPDGLSVDGANGIISGTPTGPSTSTVMVTATNASGTGSSPVTLTINIAAPVISSAGSATGAVGEAFNYQVVASNSPTGYSATGLPDGLSIDPGAGSISGTPTTAGTYTVNLSATNSGGSGTAVLTLTIDAAVPVIASPATASGQVGQPFSYQIAASNNPTSYGATGLPAGLSVDPVAGGITGTPLAAGTSIVTINATNTSGPGSATLTITIAPIGGASPPVASGLVIWLEGDTGVQSETVNGVATSAWKDQSGQGNDATQSVVYNGAIAAPAGVANALNGHSVIHFTQSQQQTLSLSLSTLGTSGAGDIFAVVREPGAANADQEHSIPALWQFGQNGTFLMDKYGAVDDTFSGFQYQYVAGAPVSFATFNLYNVSASGSTWTNNLNGKVLQTTNTNSYTAPSVGTLGTGIAYTKGSGLQQQVQQGTYFDGDIAEILVYNRVLTAQERLAVGQYLDAKFSLPNVGTPASPPSNLQAKALNSTGVYLTWSDTAQTYGVFYQVQRQSGGTGFSTIATVTGSTTYFDTTAVQGTAYNYQIISDSYSGSAGASNMVSVTTGPNPTNIPGSGLALWLRADVGVAGPSSTVAVWADQSGNGNNALSMALTNSPTLVANAQSGNPAVQFASSSNETLSFPNVLPNATVAEMFVIIRSAPSGMSGAYSFGPFGTDFYSASPTDQHPLSKTISDGFMEASQIATGVPTNVNQTNFNLYNVTASADQWVNRLNSSYLSGGTGGNPISSLNDPPALTASGILGNDGGVRGVGFTTPGSYFDGYIAEVIAYNRNLSVSERLAVGEYLQAKYGLSGVSAPTIPTSVTATVDPFGSVVVSWPNIPGATAYTIERSIDGQPSTVVATVGADTSTGMFVDFDALTGTNLRYQVQAVGYAGQSGFSAAASTPAPYAIDPVTGLQYWVEADIGNSPLPSPPTQPPTPPSGPPGTSPPTLTLTIPAGATLQ